VRVTPTASQFSRDSLSAVSRSEPVQAFWMQMVVEETKFWSLQRQATLLPQSPVGAPVTQGTAQVGKASWRAVRAEAAAAEKRAQVAKTVEKRIVNELRE
jgi:hypothetical protein